MSKNMIVAEAADVMKTTITDFLCDNPTAVVKQSGTTLFALDSVQYGVSADYRRCVLSFWSEFLNLRRTVVAAEPVKGCLRITTSRLGTNKQEVLWLTPDAATHAFTSAESARLRYADVMRRALERQLIESGDAFLNHRQTNLVKLEQSGPFVRGTVRQGRHRWAAIGVSRYERVENIQGLLRHGLMLLTRYRSSSNAHTIAGLKVFCPPERSSMMKFRVGWLARPDEVEFYELEEDGGEIRQLQLTREMSCLPDIVGAFNAEALVNSCLVPLAELLGLLPPKAATKIDLQPMSPTLLSVRLKGLEFASVCYEPHPGSFERRASLYHCMGRKRVALIGPEAKRRFKLQVAALFQERDADAIRTMPFYRTGADGWLAKIVRESITEFEPRIDPRAIYRAVECSSDGVTDSIDLLAISRTRQLIIVHIRATENTLFPMHGLDQWIRIRELNRTGKLRAAGYFPLHEISEMDPCFIFVAPALRLREDNEQILRYISRDFSWTYIAVDENWRQVSQVIYRKQSEKPRRTRDDEKGTRLL